ncbi:unnamed protein product [Pieris brassicae]|uniref:Uncharacterized protein n=1 Tax=Pieris brassicae TaxID=7116 RepID=A0A9P0TUI8_PIEBR|nr:unnamed protein product [Pieris brassicae]
MGAFFILSTITIQVNVRNTNALEERQSARVICTTPSDAARLTVASNKGVFLSFGAALPPRCPWRREAASVGRPRIDIGRDLGLRARLAGHLPTSTPQARVYITRHPPPTTLHRYTPADYRLQSKLHWYVHAICARSRSELSLGPPPRLL